MAELHDTVTESNFCMWFFTTNIGATVCLFLLLQNTNQEVHARGKPGVYKLLFS